jgi:putative nucleotidyltransferase with HDIG domain
LTGKGLIECGKPHKLKERVPAFISRILNRLRALDHQAYIVGGAVRDGLLGRPIWDWDVATSASSDGVAEIFGEVRQVRFKEGTTVLVHKGQHYEVTVFRGENGSIEGDLAGRDFTIDAMAYDDLNDVILDPFHGREDLRNQTIRAVGQAAARFEEDPLRLLRAVRLATELRFRIHRATATAISRMTPLLRGVAPERIRDELVRTIVTPKPSTGLRMMAKLGILDVILPELSECRRVRQSAAPKRQSVFNHLLETVDGVEPNPHLRLSALFHDIAKPKVKENISGRWQFPDHAQVGAAMAEETMKRLRFSRKMVAQASLLIRYHQFDHPMEKDSDIKMWVQCVGRDNVLDLIALRRADLMACELQQKCQELDRMQAKVDDLMKARMVLTPGDLALDGQGVMKTLGLLPGPRVGKALRELVAYVTEHPSCNNRKALRARLLEMRAETD